MADTQTTISVAPNGPGTKPHWTSSAKDGVGTAVSQPSRVWFSLSHGIVDEVYCPRIDRPAIKDCGLLITSDDGKFYEEKKDTEHTIRALKDGVPGYEYTNRSKDGRFTVTKTVVTDPERDVLLQKIVFDPHWGSSKNYAMYLLLAPHLLEEGEHNTAWNGSYKGRNMLFAKRKDQVLAIGCSTPWKSHSIGYVGVNDGWQQINAKKAISAAYDIAEDGNVALTGEIDLQLSNGEVVVAIGFGANEEEAGQKAHASLQKEFDRTSEVYIRDWSQLQNTFTQMKSHSAGDDAQIDLYRASIAVLKTHESKEHPGSIIASLSIPWGSSKGDTDIYGYHVVWPRDQVEAATAIYAAGNKELAAQTLSYLLSTQEDDGHWPQNMWVSGKRLWEGIQTDETAFFILLADLLKNEDLPVSEQTLWSAIKSAATFLVGYGPSTEQDRWEENGGYSIFTLSVSIAALLAAAEFAVENDEAGLAAYLRETADIWYDHIDRLTYVRGTKLSEKFGVDGYYVRLTPKEGDRFDVDPATTQITLKNLPDVCSTFPVSDIVSPDALALVRFGLREPNDKRIVNTLKVIDGVLKAETKSGPVWHRYTHDGYGEDSGGRPFDGVGIGRGWPLLVGERAHYELAAGNVEECHRLMAAMSKMTGKGALLPEQIWESADKPEHGLFNGKPSGSGMPLVWAHAEYVKLVRSVQDGSVFGIAPQARKRYESLNGKAAGALNLWRKDYKISSLPNGTNLRIEALKPFKLRWTDDDWKTVHDVTALDRGVGVYTTDLNSETASSNSFRFTFYWTDDDQWEGEDYSVSIER